MWLEDMYMRNPLALPVNSNPGMVFPRHLSKHITDEKTHLKFAAKVTSRILDYKDLLDTYVRNNEKFQSNRDSIEVASDPESVLLLLVLQYHNSRRL